MHAINNVFKENLIEKCLPFLPFLSIGRYTEKTGCANAIFFVRLSFSRSHGHEHECMQCAFADNLPLCHHRLLPDVAVLYVHLMSTCEVTVYMFVFLFRSSFCLKNSSFCLIYISCQTVYLGSMSVFDIITFSSFARRRCRRFLFLCHCCVFNFRECETEQRFSFSS